MKATVLSDNIPFDNLGSEWGLSIYITYKDKILVMLAGGIGVSGLCTNNASPVSESNTNAPRADILTA